MSSEAVLIKYFFQELKMPNPAYAKLLAFQEFHSNLFSLGFQDSCITLTF